MTALRMIAASVLAVTLLPHEGFGACSVNDSDFTTANGGCQDLTSGIVWSSTTEGYRLPIDAQNLCNHLGTTANGGGYSDWRLPTVGEIDEAIANGLNSHLDFSYAAGNQGVDAVYRHTGCQTKLKGLNALWDYRFSDGSVIRAAEFRHTICVRNVGPPDVVNGCPGNGKKKNDSGATSVLSQTSTGALLLLPLAVVLAARGLRPRRQMRV